MTSLHLLTLLIFITIASCRQPSSKNVVTVVMTESLQTPVNKKEQESQAKRKQIDDEGYVDSLRLDKVLQDALKIANKNFSKDRFIEKYDIFPDSIPVSVEINLDFYFTKAKPHLIIRRSVPSAIYFNIYTKGDNKFEKVVSHEQWNMTYVSDTIRDINGDGRNDFVVNWYGSSGCCLKSFSNVYLLSQDQKTFSDNFEFINPSFSPKEKVVRGVCYGHPGETEMYKYKWKVDRLDTVEYVSYEKNAKGMKTGMFLLSTDRSYSDKFKILKVLNSIPAEYKKIEGYDWFTGSGYE